MLIQNCILYLPGIARYKNRNTESISGPTSLHINCCVFHLALAFVGAFYWVTLYGKNNSMRDLVFNCQGGILFEQHYNSFCHLLGHIFSADFFGLFTLLILYMPDHRAIGWKSLSLHSHFHIHYVHLLGQLSVCYTSQPKTSKEQKVKVEESNSAPKQKCPTILVFV